MDIWNVVAAAAAIVSIATVAGFGLQRGYTMSLKEQLSSAREENVAQRKQIEGLKVDRDSDRATIARLASDIRVLQSVVTGEVHWQAISEVLDHHHESAERHWENTERTLGEILSTLRKRAS